MAKINIYINEQASRSNTDLWKRKLKKYLFRHQLTFSQPKTIKALKKEIAKDKKNKTQYIFSIGGDGTANLIAQEIVNTDIELMIIPCGTANDFATELGINLNVENIIKIFKYKTTKKVDLIKINEKYMFSNGGLGLPADVASLINSYRKKSHLFKRFMKKAKSKVYFGILLKEFLSKPLKFYKLKLKCTNLPSIQSEIFASMLLINNQPKLGNEFLVAPQTQNDDGIFNVSIFLHTSKFRLAKTILAVYMGTYKAGSDTDFISFETNEMEVQHMGRKNITFFGDGEALEHSRKFKIKIQPNSLKVSYLNQENPYSQSHSLEKVQLT